MAHLLTAINGYANLLEHRTLPDDPRQANIREIRKAGERAANLVRQLLAFGRKQALEPRVLDLRETLGDSLLEEIGIAPQDLDDYVEDLAHRFSKAA